LSIGQLPAAADQPRQPIKSAVSRSAKRVFASALSRLPLALRKDVLRRAALAPLLLKTRSFERLCAQISDGGMDRQELIETNLGLASRFRCRVPLHKAHYAFGRPQNSAFERSTIALVSELSKDCGHFLDVGAHEGIFTFSVFRTRGKNVTLHWFEPDRVLSSRLWENLQRNSIESHANRAAAADVNGHSTFFRNLTDDLSGSLGTLFQSRHSTERETVETVRLSDYIAAKGVSRAIVKVDVEGTGAQLWSGLSERFREISYLVIEMLSAEIEDRLPARIIRQTGWHAYYIRDFELIGSRNGEFIYVEPFWNWLFCALDPSALRQRLAGTRFQVISAV
jgi:FkbM family methyltransferase